MSTVVSESKHAMLQLGPRVSESGTEKVKCHHPSSYRYLGLDQVMESLLITINNNYFYHLGRSQKCVGAG